MNRRPLWTLIRLGVAALLLLAVTAAESPGCKKRGTVESDRPPQDRQVDPKQGVRVVLILANSYGPYTVLVIAQEQGRAGIDRTGPEHIAYGEYRQTLAYTTGLKIDIKVTVSGSENDVMVCHIEDGGSNRVQDRGYGRATCTLTTGR